MSDQKGVHQLIAPSICKKQRLGIDLTGGDVASIEIISAIERALLLFPEVTFILYVYPDRESFHKETEHSPIWASSRCCVQAVAERITMDDSPIEAIRRKKRSALILGIQQLKKNQCDAFISACNTGALIAAATLLLPRFSGIHRPALLALLPTETHKTALIDVGGSVTSKSKHLIQFAYLGALFQKICCSVQQPRVALLNIGAESKKGTSDIREAYFNLSEPSHQPHFLFYGNIEGQEPFEGKVDVVVSSGFSGNIFLKTAEGVVKWIFQRIQRDLAKIPSLHSLVKDKLQSIAEELKGNGGAFVCGVDGLVVKCHGRSSSDEFLSAIQWTTLLLEKRVIQRMKEEYERIAFITPKD